MDFYCDGKSNFVIEPFNPVIDSLDPVFLLSNRWLDLERWPIKAYCFKASKATTESRIKLDY